MSAVLAYPYEDELVPGCAVVVGEGAGAVALPGEGGAGTFAGVFSYEGNCDKEHPDSQDTVGITIHGQCKVKASGAVSAFEFGQVADATGAIKTMVNPPASLPIKIPGFFLEDGADGDIVDFFINPFVIPAVVEEDEDALAALAEHVAAADPHGQYEKETDLALALAVKADLVDGKVPAAQLP
jgi:hypothetical protein